MKPSFKKTKEQRHRLFVGLIYPLWAYHNLILFGAEKFFFLPLGVTDELNRGMVFIAFQAHTEIHRIKLT